MQAAVPGIAAKADIMANGTAWILNNGVAIFTQIPRQYYMISAEGPGTPNIDSAGTDLFWLTSGFILPQPVLCIDPGS